MNTVTFPGLGLTLHLNRVAFSIGDFHHYCLRIFSWGKFLLRQRQKIWNETG